jgi:hypothetical protein
VAVAVGALGHTREVITLLAVSMIKVAPSGAEYTAPRLPLSWDTRREP